MAAISSAVVIRASGAPAGSAPSTVRTATRTAPPTRLSSSVTPHSRSSRPQTAVPCLAMAAATGSKKFSVNSSERPTTRNTRPIANASAPNSLARPGPSSGSTSASTTPSAVMPKTMVTPAMKPVDTCSSGGMSSRRRPSFSARS